MFFKRKVLDWLYAFICLSLFGSTGYGQTIIASKYLVCPGEAVTLSINDKALSSSDFCVTPIGDRFGLYYFKTCNRVPVEDAILMAKIMNGYLATANDAAKNSYLFNRLPNDIHWIGYFQNPKIKTFNDPPNPASGFEWMSKEPDSAPFWVDGEPNNLESVSPGRYVIQGCRKDASWCDENGNTKYVGIIESKKPTIPVIVNPTILWSTGETSKSIVVRPGQSTVYKVTISYGTSSFTDSILIETPEATVAFSKPGGCNPYKWKPEITSNTPLNELDITWTLGATVIINDVKPTFLVNSDGFITGSVSVKSSTCNSSLLNKSELFDLYPMTNQAPVKTTVRLNENVSILPKNEGPYTYTWFPKSGLSEPNSYNPSFIALKDSKFSLTVKDDFGCTASESFIYNIDPNLSIFTPSTFSPDNNGINDVFNFKLESGFYGSISNLQIFDRWGELIYQSDAPYNWDGKVKGKNAEEGMYMYQINYTILGRPYKKQGSILLQRITSR